ncbi:MAG TPA: ATP-binding protein [Gemmatimonadales bacterium]|nr:ATP-binding protein [Gemmatimonadales bacterium]
MTWLLRNELTPHSGAALVAAASGASVAALGGLVVAGWLTVAVALIQVLPGLPPMQYNTALGFMICGAAMLAAALELRRPTALLGALAALIGLATLSQFVLGIDLGIDDLLVETYVITGVSNPGRMPPNTALGLTLIGAALMGLSWPTISKSRHLYPALLGSIVIALGTAALVGYAADMPGAYGWGHFNRMSVHTALGFILLGGGVVGLAWNVAQSQTSEAPSWLPTLAGVAVASVTLCLWYALVSPAPPQLEHTATPASIPNGILPNITLAAGLLSAVLLGWSLKVEQTARQRARSLAASNLALDQQSQAREKAEEMLHQLAAIVQNSNDAIIATTLDGTVLTWNAGAERLYGYSEEEVRGRHVSFLHSRKEQAHDLFKRVVWGEIIQELETVNLTKDGRKIDVSLSISPMLDRTGRVIGASSIARDITERKQLDQMKDEFVGTVSHELRTPLTAIKGFIELVADGDAGPLTEAQREFLQIASRNTDRLGSLIDDLLDINRIDSQCFEIRIEPIDLTAVLNDVAATFGPMAQAKGLAFHCKIDPLPSIMGDGARLVQVFSNLASNAIKYTPEGEVGIRARRADAGIEVVVYDSGIGLTKEERSQLFTKFFRGRNPVVTESGGTGLGLVIAKAIIEKHRGIIEVATVPGEGTHFRVVLPLQVAG